MLSHDYGYAVLVDNPNNLAAFARDIAELARERHLTVASSNSLAIAASDSETYRRSQALLLAAIRAAYPDVNDHLVYNVWLDCLETISYCAEFVRNNPEHAARL